MFELIHLIMLKHTHARPGRLYGFETGSKSQLTRKNRNRFAARNSKPYKHLKFIDIRVRYNMCIV